MVAEASLCIVASHFDYEILRITAETNKIEWRWIRPCLIVANVINICSLYCSQCYHHFSVQLSHAYTTSEWFARFIGFCWSSWKTCVFLCCCRCHLLICFVFSVALTLKLVIPTIGFILVNGCCVKREWKHEMNSNYCVNATTVQHTYHSRSQSTLFSNNNNHMSINIFLEKTNIEWASGIK